MAGAKPEVVGIAEDDLSAEQIEFIGMESLDRSLRANRHKYRGFDNSVRQLQAPKASLGAGIRLDEGKRHGEFKGKLPIVERGKFLKVWL